MAKRSRPSLGSALAMLGLARRAGAVEPGVDRARNAVRSGRAQLLVVASDGSAVQRIKVEPVARHADVPVLELGSGAELGAALGMPPVTAVAVTDRALARAVRESAGAQGRPTQEDGAAHAGI